MEGGLAMAVWSTINMSYGLSNKRLDAERYKPQFLNNEKYLSSIKWDYLKKYIVDISGGATPKGAKYPNDGIKFVRVQNIRDNYFDLSDVVYIDNAIHSGQLLRSQIKESDVLLTITGSYGNSSVAFAEMLPANINQHSVRIALKKGLLPEFLSTFLCCKYGHLQSDSKITGDTRPALTYPEIGNYMIPILDIQYQREIQNIVRKSLEQRLLSQSLYQQAEELLEKELRLDSLKLTNQKVYQAGYSDVMANGRVDAEFYNPQLIQCYKYFSNEVSLKLKPITNFLVVKKFSNPIYANNGVPIITQRHLSNISPENYGDYPLADSIWCNRNNDALLKLNDLLFYSVGAYLGKTNIWLNDDDAVFASFITLLRCYNPIDSCFLMLLLNSSFGTLQSNVFKSGTSQPYIYPKDIKQFMVPDVDVTVKQALDDLIHKSYNSKQQSKLLLEQAKHRVEELIEQEATKTTLKI